MKTMLRWAGAIALALMPLAAFAQSVGSSVQFPAGWAPGTSICVKQVDGTCVPVSAANPLPTSGAGGSGGGSVTQPDQYGSGTIAAGTANAAYTVPVANGAGVAGFTVTGLTAAAATLAIETSNDKGTTWTPANGLQGSTGVLFNTVAADGQFRVNTGGRTMVRLRVATAGSGTVNVTSNLSVASTEIAMSSPLPPGTNSLGDVRSTPIAYTSTTAAVTIAAAATYQSVLAANPARKGCMIMATSSTTANIRLGAPGTATATNVIPLAAGQTFSCANVNGTTLGDEISMSTPAANATLLVISQ
jgi:hypothetical protein